MAEKICGIYKITSPTKKIYIGKSINIYKRWKYYKAPKQIKDTKITNSLKKHGHLSHIFEIIHICDESLLNYLEKEYIIIYGTFNTFHGLNLTDGGEGGAFSDESKEKIRKIHKGRVTSPATKLKLSIAAKTANKGRVITPEMREKCRIGSLGNTNAKGHRLSKEFYSEMGKKNRGKKRSEETRKKMSDGQKRRWRTTLSIH